MTAALPKPAIRPEICKSTYMFFRWLLFVIDVSIFPLNIANSF